MPITPLRPTICKLFHSSSQKYLVEKLKMQIFVIKLLSQTQNTPLISQGGISIFACIYNDYSIIVATRPEPTVLPPSRYEGSVQMMKFLKFTLF